MTKDPHKRAPGSKTSRSRRRPAPDADWAFRLIEGSTDLICLCQDGRVTYINGAGRALLGAAAADHVIGHRLADFIHADDHALAENLTRGGVGQAFVPMRLVRTDGRTVDARVLAMAVDGTADRMVVHARVSGAEAAPRIRAEGGDALSRARAEVQAEMAARSEELSKEMAERLRAEENLRLAAKVIETTNEAILVADAEFRVSSVNPAFTEITGYTLDEVAGRKPPFYRVLEADPERMSEMRRTLARDGHWEGELWNKRKNGEDYAERLRLSAITDEDGRLHQVAALIGDITKRKQDEERIRYQANYDALTGLPNRTLFLDRLGQALESMKRARKKLALLFIDLDGFKLVNDTLGHDIGDLLLREAAQRLTDCVRKGDTLARLGGDEFTVIMPDLQDPRNAPMVAQRVLDSLTQPFNLVGHETFVSASIGITIFPDDARAAGDLLRNADAAMYRAKDQGKANYQFFTSDLNEEVKERLVLKNGLLRARERDEFSLSYQPKLDITTGRIISVEALMRWTSRELGVISPARFIPVIEESGMAMDLGEWVIRTACRQHRAWHEAGLPPFRVAVNLSVRQLREPRFVAVVEAALAEIGVDPTGLEIEITENMLMSDATNTVQALGSLHQLGIHVAMDDFGTGYSSLSFLKRFPIDTIKIDGSFIADIPSDSGNVEIVRAIITMAHSLNRRVAAEGVETEAQMAVLTDFGCDEIQGYFFCRPLPADELTPFLRQQFEASGAASHFPGPKAEVKRPRRR